MQKESFQKYIKASLEKYEKQVLKNVWSKSLKVWQARLHKYKCKFWKVQKVSFQKYTKQVKFSKVHKASFQNKSLLVEKRTQWKSCEHWEVISDVVEWINYYFEWINYYLEWINYYHKCWMDQLLSKIKQYNYFQPEVRFHPKKIY